jgi:hypothetical protein
MNIDNIEEVYKVVKYSFSRYEVANEIDAQNIAIRFFKKYNENFNIKQMYIDFDHLELTYNVYIAY